MPKFKQFLERNKYGALVGGSLGAILYLFHYNVTGYFFALQKIFPNMDPQLVTGSEGLIWAMLAGAMLGILLDELINFKKTYKKWQR